MSKIADLLEEINQSLSELAQAPERGAIEQALSDIALALEQRKPSEPPNLQGLIDAIGNLKLKVDIKASPAPDLQPVFNVPAAPEVRPVFNVPPASVQVVQSGMRVKELIIEREELRGLLKRVVFVYEKA